MRLIDADALKFYLVCFDNTDQWDDGISKDDLVAAPTVTCGECAWYEGGSRGIGCRFCYCGDEFERREPCPHCGATPCLGDIRSDDL
jgi:hypothetical protein